jgi:hypothetical protein
MADLIQAYFGDGRRLDLTSTTPSRTSPWAPPAPWPASGLDETFLVMNADVLTDLNYQDLVAFHRQTGGHGHRERL